MTGQEVRHQGRGRYSAGFFLFYSALDPSPWDSAVRVPSCFKLLWRVLTHALRGVSLVGSKSQQLGSEYQPSQADGCHNTERGGWG